MIINLSNWIYRAEKIIAMILCFIILISLTLGVVFRYVLSSPLTWSDEAAMFSLAWMTFIGGSMTIKAKSTPTIDIVTNIVKGTLRKIIIIIGYLLSFIFVTYILYVSIVWLSSPNILIQRSSSMAMPMIFAYLCIPVSFLFMSIHLFEMLLQSLFTAREAD
ncbi:TRAP transporter small permease [Oceanobacillus saliphilus]|uniref:TRAP transporter small permease n=1 Tax=Oceanobacillus saliphilus TaxID=2925834 RepID=UPI00201E5F49|nr:TRAP transporter small permease subunit [Oceanobacillus saliphilus]